MALILLSNNVRMPLQTWNQLIIWWKGAAGTARRVFALWDWPSKREDGESLTVDPGAPLISLRNVHFSYLREEPGGATARGVVFSGLTLDVEKGESVAVVGPSGCGKSTLLHLIAGFYEAEEGVIRFGGHDIARWRLPPPPPQSRWWGRIPICFPVRCGTIRMRANGKADMENIERAARRACIHEFIASLPQATIRPRGAGGEAVRRAAPAHRHRPRAPKGRAAAATR
jgi:ABC-type multidrug transport system fused ATPase/permease subunit